MNNFQNERSGYSKPATNGNIDRTKRHVPKGHDAILKSLQDEKAIVEFALIDIDRLFVGQITGRDKYTISLLSSDSQYPSVIYKSSIIYFKRIE